MGWVAANLRIGHQQPQLIGNDNFTAASSGTFRTAEGFVAIALSRGQSAVGEILTTAMVATVPVAALVLLFQRRTMHEPTAATVKGAADSPRPRAVDSSR